MLRKILFVFLLFCLVGILAPEAHAQTSITMRARALYEGTSKYGEWLPVVVTLENGGADLRGRVQVQLVSASGDTSYAQEVELPRGARKEVTLLAIPNTSSRRLLVTFVAEGESEPLASQEVEVRPVQNIRFMAAAITSGGKGLDSLAGINFRGELQSDEAILVPLTLETLPDRPEALRTLDLLILAGVDTSSLTPRQQVALEQYVALGGILVLGGGPEASRVLAGIPESLQPVTLAGEVGLDSLESLALLTGEAVRVTGPFLAAQGEPDINATITMTEGTTPLIVERPIGDGEVIWLALDPSLTPFDAWAGVEDFWLKLVGPSAAYPPNLPPDVSPFQLTNNQLLNALRNLPSLDLPSLRLLIPLLALYIFMVGPINYLFLKRRKRLELAWGTIPAVTLVFSLGAYGLGYQLRGNDLILNQVALVQAIPDSEGAYIRSMVGVFSPSSRSYDVSLSGEPLLAPTFLAADPFDTESRTGNEAILLQGNPAIMQGFEVTQWSMQSVVAESFATEGYGLEADLTSTDERVEGTITNRSDQRWQEVVVVFGSHFERLGDIDLGESQNVEFQIDSAPNNFFDPSWEIIQVDFGPTGPNRERQVRQQILSSLYSGPFAMETGTSLSQSSTPVLLAWLDEPPLELDVADGQASHLSTTLLYAFLPLRFGAGEVSLPRGVISARLLSNDGSTCYASGAISLSPEFSEAEIQFSLPAEVQAIDPSLLTLHLSVDGGDFSEPELALYDYENDAWNVLANTSLGRNKINEPDAFFTDGTFLLRVTNNEEFLGSCLFFDASVEGILN